MADAPRRCLVLSPGLAGHREVYVRVIAGWLAARGVAVSLAADLSEAARLATPLLEDLADILGGRVFDLSAEPDGGAAMSWRQTRGLLERAAVDAAVVTEADDHIGALSAAARRGARRFPGRLVGIFLRSTNYIYGPAETPAGQAGRRGRRRSGAGRRVDARRFHEVVQPGRRPLAAALCLDERFVATAPPGHHWLPDISTAFEDGQWGGSVGQAAHPEAGAWRRRLDGFLAAAGDRPLLAYLGAAQRRRGYDRVLRLASRTGGVVAHCGRPPSTEDGDVARLRAELLAAGRLLELGGPYASSTTASLTLKAARCVVLPYRSHLGSSGVMLQALAAGRPVLVPDEGLMGWRTRSFGLGETVDAGDEAALAAAFVRLHRRGPEPYAEALTAFTGFFSRSQVEAALSAALGFGGPGARVPHPDDAGWRQHHGGRRQAVDRS